MKKQFTGSLVATAALLAIAGIAQAAPAELNIYGASAQYTYWNAQAQHYLQSRLGCTATAPVNNGGKHGFSSGTSCTSTLVPVNAATGHRDLDIRYSGIASAEGPLAVSHQAPLDATLAAGCIVANGERQMFASTSTTVCKPVHIGVNTAGLTPNNTVVVPFGFFVNSAVTAQTCTAGLIGNYCTANTQCDTAPGSANGTCGTAATITNISREEATLIFSQQVGDWSDLGAYFTAQPVVACLRHAGSGTHSTLDLAVMNTNWGNSVATAESVGSPTIWFNQGSGDEIKCVNGATTATPNGSLAGAIGYADADQAIGVANTSQNVKQLKFNGFYPTRTAIRNGLYDFYSNAWLYTNGPTTGLAADLVAYAQDPANVPVAKANYWAAQGEMKYNKGTDTQYPAFVGASSPLLP